MFVHRYVFIFVCLYYSGLVNGAANQLSNYFVKQYVKGKINGILSKIDQNNECVHAMAKVVEGVKKLEPWAVQMVDSSSKIASGLTAGNMFDFGAFDLCLAVNHQKNGTRIKGKYCLYATYLSFIPPEVQEMINSNDFMRNNELFHNGTTIPFLRALCVPDACSVRDIEDLYNASEFEKTVPNITAEFGERTCQTLDQNNLRTWSVEDWLGVSFFAFTAFLILLSTSYEIFIILYNKKPAHQILLSFSVHNNFRKLISVTDSPDQIQCINGLRFLSIMWVILGHRYLFGGFYPNINSVSIVQDWAIRYTSSVITGATVSVDTFFFISGLLVIYIVLLAKSQGIQFNLFHYYLHRYIRLTPALAAVIILYESIYKHLGAGPIWPLSTPVLTEACDDRWWHSLLYIQNFFRGKSICVGQSWYLAIDTQLYVLAPLIFYPIMRWPRITLSAMGLLTFGSCYTGFQIAWNNKADAKFFSGFQFFNKIYASTAVRAQAWLVGAIIGYILFRTRGMKIKINKWVVVCIWTMVLTVMILDVMASTLFLRFQYNRITSSMYYGFSRATWAAGLAWIVFACVHGYGGLINKFLSCKLFMVLGRLTYSMFLTHLAVLGYTLGTGRINHNYSDMDNIHAFWGDLMFILFVSLCWTLAFESPVVAVGKILIPTRMLKPQIPKSDTNGNIATRF